METGSLSTADGTSSLIEPLVDPWRLEGGESEISGDSVGLLRRGRLRIATSLLRRRPLRLQHIQPNQQQNHPTRNLERWQRDPKQANATTMFGTVQLVYRKRGALAVLTVC